jgi:hypothetical protein
MFGISFGEYYTLLLRGLDGFMHSWAVDPMHDCSMVLSCSGVAKYKFFAGRHLSRWRRCTGSSFRGT